MKCFVFSPRHSAALHNVLTLLTLKADIMLPSKRGLVCDWMQTEAEDAVA